MILLQRPPAPSGLVRKQKEWTHRWVVRRPSQWATASAQKLLREHLLPMSRHKCADCESLLGGGAQFEVEHYHAKTAEPALVFEWNNLYPSCGMCNRAKLEQKHNGDLLRSDSEDGETFFWLNQTNGELEPHDTLGPDQRLRADRSIALCKLNRGGLCRDRLQQYQSAKRCLDAIEQTGSLPEKLVLNFVAFLDPSESYKLAIRTALPTRLADVDRRMFHHAG